MQTLSDQPAEKMRLALEQLETSLQLLDEADAPAEIGAHVDLAIHRLRAALDGSAASDLN